MSGDELIDGAGVEALQERILDQRGIPGPAMHAIGAVEQIEHASRVPPEVPVVTVIAGHRGAVVIDLPQGEPAPGLGLVRGEAPEHRQVLAMQAEQGRSIDLVDEITLAISAAILQGSLVAAAVLRMDLAEGGRLGPREAVNQKSVAGGKRDSTRCGRISGADYQRRQQQGGGEGDDGVSWGSVHGWRFPSARGAATR